MPVPPRMPPRWFLGALLPIAAGVAWLAFGWGSGLVAGVLASLPGGLLLGTGTALLVWPGDRQVTHYMALGALLSLPLALVILPWVGFWSAFWLLLFGLLAFFTAGRAALLQNPVPAGVPVAKVTTRMAVKAALDEAILAYFLSVAHVPGGGQVERDVAELKSLEDAQEELGWDASPASFHQRPPPAEPRLRETRAGGRVFRHLSFDSEYQPHPALPGGERWLSYTANQTAHAWLLRHEGAPRPWLICVHGYRMGVPWADFSLFGVDYLHHRLGLNVVMPILPLHGPRSRTRLSGGGYLDGPMVDLFHAEAQAVWDLRRVLYWLRESQEAPAVGVLGHSLGGYNAALLAALETDLACVVAGIPVSDLAEILWRHMPRVHLRYLESQGVNRRRLRELLAPVSPLALPAGVAPERRALIAAVGDQVVPPEQALKLWHHWGEPGCYWYQGSHMSLRREATVAAHIGRILEEHGLTAKTADSSAVV